MQKVYILCTGGTIEKVYLEHSGSVQNIQGKIDRYLQRLRLPGLRVQTLRLMNKDSLEMTDADRHQILRAVRNRLKKPAPIIITHGTDTVVQTGLFLERNLPNLEVPVILTGAMTPLGFERSDGLQSLTESLLAARILQPGVYLVIHNQVFPIGRVRKDRERAQFVWKRAGVRSQPAVHS